MILSDSEPDAVVIQADDDDENNMSGVILQDQLHVSYYTHLFKTSLKKRGPNWRLDAIQTFSWL